MKQFQCPNGLRVWNSAESGRETRFIYKEIFEQHCYEKHGLAVKNGDLILDVGANIGMFPLSFMQRFRDLRIYCFEPVPATRECLTRNLAESPAKANHQIAILDDAVGARNAEATLEYFPVAPGNSTMYSTEKRHEVAAIVDRMGFADVWKADKKTALLVLPLFPFRRRLFKKVFQKLFSNPQSIPVHIQTLSDIIRREHIDQVNYLKIDVEGAEMDVIAGIEDEHWPIISQIAMEAAPANKRYMPALSDRLRSLGFTEIIIETMLGTEGALDDPLPCTLYAVRSLSKEKL